MQTCECPFLSVYVSTCAALCLCRWDALSASAFVCVCVCVYLFSSLFKGCFFVFISMDSAWVHGLDWWCYWKCPGTGVYPWHQGMGFQWDIQACSLFVHMSLKPQEIRERIPNVFIVSLLLMLCHDSCTQPKDPNCWCMCVPDCERVCTYIYIHICVCVCACVCVHKYIYIYYIHISYIHMLIQVCFYESLCMAILLVCWYHVAACMWYVHWLGPVFQCLLRRKPPRVHLTQELAKADNW